MNSVGYTILETNLIQAVSNATNTNLFIIIGGGHLNTLEKILPDLGYIKKAIYGQPCQNQNNGKDWIISAVNIKDACMLDIK